MGTPLASWSSQGFVEEETTPLPQALLQGHEEAGSVTLTGQPGSLEAVI